MINEQGAWSYAAQEVLGGQHGENSVMMQKPFLRFKMMTFCRRRIANFQ
ncbi:MULTISPECIES: hypothetical protein [Bacillus]|uniref:Uncharacterized protein n=1 Tax=Bacillus amyloliquefaciens (strain Y2) TaxID=1155777 RepID=I2C3X8_BACAY|nr:MULTISPECIES: hypothetical protein [Bacillus]AFJ61352.1 hypothetical protein MUS_1333 [Bacillus velezensis YAU B9601-Y2]MBL4957468.1 hypothetical protein [Bacillus velezensis]MBY0032471.1 hypothetical protein [Bacillus velezensis]MBY0041511.1 hypothetical protein [Bacillus velezensis]MCK6099179.1 hypothetical protein [Bacillus velezensis]